jgi:hypothetical protein
MHRGGSHHGWHGSGHGRSNRPSMSAHRGGGRRSSQHAGRGGGHHHRHHHAMAERQFGSLAGR